MDSIVAPAGLMMSDGYLQADFAIRRNDFNLYKLPGTAPDFIKADKDPRATAREHAASGGGLCDAHARV